MAVGVLHGTLRGDPLAEVLTMLQVLRPTSNPSRRAARQADLRRGEVLVLEQAAGVVAVQQRLRQGQPPGHVGGVGRDHGQAEPVLVGEARVNTRTHVDQPFAQPAAGGRSDAHTRFRSARDACRQWGPGQIALSPVSDSSKASTFMPSPRHWSSPE